MKTKETCSSSDLLKIYGLGRFLIKYGENEKKTDDWTSEKALKMFKYFLLNRNKEIYNEELVEVFWPEIDPETGKKRLYNTIYLLRKNIGIKDIIVNKTTSYKFNNRYSCWTDWEYFLDIYNNISENITTEQLIQAVKLYRGDLMPALRYEYWVEDIRTNVKEKYLDIIYKLSEQLYKEHKYIQSLSYLQRGINEESYREEYYELAMKNLVKTGRIYEALCIYEKYRKLIKEELGIEPGTDINKTYLKIKNSEMIKQHIDEQVSSKGALICDVEVFNKIYELENRQITRTDKNFTILEIDFSELKLSNQKIESLSDEIATLFRSGDIICYCDNIVNILLHEMDIEKTNYILKRVFKFLKEKDIRQMPKFDFKEVSPKNNKNF